HDVIVAPTFPPAEFARKKAETLGEIASERDDPETVASNELGPFLLGSSPLAHPVVGWEKSVKTLTRADVVIFHHQRVVPANAILGGGFTSRLVNEIRVVQGLTYSISSRWPMYRNAGTYEISTFTRNETLRKTIDATLAEVQKLVDAGPTQAELDKAKRYLTG